METKVPSFSINSLLRRASLFTVAATSLLLLQCQEQGSFNPAGPDLRLVIVSDLTAFPNRVPAGGGTSVISGRVIDQQQKPFLETRVAFDAAKGSITLADTTDSLGRFSADYRSGSTAGLDTVTVVI